MGEPSYGAFYISGHLGNKFYIRKWLKKTSEDFMWVLCCLTIFEKDFGNDIWH